jgi:hypothetical protein
VPNHVARCDTNLLSREKKSPNRAKIVWQRASRALCSARDSHRLSRDELSSTRDGRAGQAARGTPRSATHDFWTGGRR